MTYLVAFGVPLALLIIGAVVKNLIRDAPYEARDFFLGVELNLSALGSSLIYLTEIFSTNSSSGTDQYLPLFIVFSLIALLIVMSFHQKLEKQPQNKIAQGFVLGGLCNTIGFATFISFIVIIKGVSV